MHTITFSVRFHTPFLVRSGAGGSGLDALSRPDAALPASSVKGAMRAAAQYVLAVDPTLLGAVFGQEGRLGGRLGAGAWAWTDARSTAPLRHGVRARNRVDVRAASSCRRR